MVWWVADGTCLRPRPLQVLQRQLTALSSGEVEKSCGEWIKQVAADVEQACGDLLRWGRGGVAAVIAGRACCSCAVAARRCVWMHLDASALCGMRGISSTLLRSAWSLLPAAAAQ